MACLKIENHSCEAHCFSSLTIKIQTSSCYRAIAHNLYISIHPPHSLPFPFPVLLFLFYFLVSRPVSYLIGAENSANGCHR